MPGMCGMKLTLDEFQGEGVHFATVFFFGLPINTLAKYSRMAWSPFGTNIG